MPNFTYNGTLSNSGINPWARLREAREQTEYAQSQIYDLENNLISYISNPCKVPIQSNRHNNKASQTEVSDSSLISIPKILTNLSVCRAHKLESMKAEYYWSETIEEFQKNPENKKCTFHYKETRSLNSNY